MKTKLLTLLTLLVCVCTGAWAADFVDTYGNLSSLTGTYAGNGISKITLVENASLNSGIQASSNGATMKFTVSTPAGFTVKTVTFSTSNVGTITTNDASGTYSAGTYTASSSITSVEFTVPSTSGKQAKITNLVVTVSSSTTDDYELITPSSVSAGVISYTSSLGDDKLVTGMNTIGDGVSVSAGSIDFGNGKGFSITTSRAIKSVYCVWYQRVPQTNGGWTGYSESTYVNSIGTYTLSTNAWVAPNSNTKYVAFKRSEGSTAKISRIHIFYYASTVPSISASNISVFENTASAGEINFTVDKLGTTGSVTAATAAGWVTLGDVDNVNGKAPFTVTANTTGDYRSATVTLTYTYDTSKTVTRNVTVTQSPDFSGTEIVKLVLKNTVTGTIGGEADVLAQDRTANGCKLGSKGHYAGITLDHGETFKAGDIVEVNIGTAGGGKFIFYDDNVATNALLTTDITPAVGTYRFVLPAAVNGHSSIYLVRGTSSDKNDGFNPFVDYISVTRPDAVVTLNTSGFATFSYGTDFNFLGMAGAKAYKMTLNEETKAIAGTEISASTKIKAGEGILLKGTASTPFAITTTTGAEALGSNDLKGSTKSDGTTAAKPTYCYVLSGDTFVSYTGATLSANKAYFEASKDLAASARPFTITFDDEETTSIAGVEAKKFVEDNKFYNLNGQQVAQPTKGLYIVNGKKVVIK